MATGTEAIDLPRPFGPYTLTRRLAVGGMAEVYVAKTQGIGGFEKLLAIKVIHPTYSEDEQFVTMLVEEAKLSVLLNHNNVVQTFDLGCTDDTYFIAMELVEGADCYRMIKALRSRQAALPLDISAYIVSAVCSALDYAHRKRDSQGNPLRIVHRDVSPQNVLVSFSGDVKLADFGIAKAALRTQNTQVGVIKGKYYYMSPEQAWGDPMDLRSDIFSAGVLLHELLTGQMLYQAENLPELLDRVRKAEVQPPSAYRRDVPAELDAITMKALARRPEDRYESAHDFGQALTQFLYQHQPSFTTARVARLMAQLFTEEYAAATGAPPVSSEKVLGTDPGKRDSVALKMTVDEYEPGASVIFDMKRTRDDLPTVDRASRSDDRPTNPNAIRVTARPPRYTSKQAPPVQVRRTPDDEDEPTTMLDRGALPLEDVASELDAAGFDDDEATVVEDVFKGLDDALKDVPVRPAPGGRGSPLVELSASLAEDADVYLNAASPTASAIPRAPRIPREAAAILTPKTPTSAGPERTEAGGQWRSTLRWVLVATVVGVVTYLVIARAIKPAPLPVVRIDSVPPGAELFLDGESFGGTTPARIEGLVVGADHAIQLRLAGYEPWTTHLRVLAGEQEQVAELVPLTRVVEVVSEPPGAEVRCDGVVEGRTPLRLGRRRVGDALDISVTIDGREPVSHELVVLAGEGVQTLRVLGQ
ncbi:MAG: serine/threonine-protein kinase [Polyangiales bacterium]|nr:serine/threonine protein kinase [Myxococcales bacterium]